LVVEEGVGRRATILDSNRDSIQDAGDGVGVKPLLLLVVAVVVMEATAVWDTMDSTADTTAAGEVDVPMVGHTEKGVAMLKALVWFWLIDETLSANLVYQSDHEIGSTTPSDEAMTKIMTMVMAWL